MKSLFSVSVCTFLLIVLGVFLATHSPQSTTGVQSKHLYIDAGQCVQVTIHLTAEGGDTVPGKLASPNMVDSQTLNLSLAGNETTSPIRLRTIIIKLEVRRAPAAPATTP